LHILIADDSEDDIALLRHALKRAGIPNPVHACRDGQEALDYLKGDGIYADRIKHPFPRMLILDLKMPNLTGLEVLRWVKEHPECCVIPTIIVTNSREPQDVREAYTLGANAYFVKPSKLEDTQNLFKNLQAFWSMAELPELPAKC